MYNIYEAVSRIEKYLPEVKDDFIREMGLI